MTLNSVEPDRAPVAAVLSAFGFRESVVSVDRLAGGHIHSTLRVVTAHHDLVLQSVNEHVFRDLSACESNLSRIDRHFRREDAPVAVPRLHRTELDEVHWRDDFGVAWRVADFASGTEAAVSARNRDVAYGAAHAFGRYVSWLSGMRGGPLRETIPDFHDLAGRARSFADAVADDRVGRLRNCRDLVVGARRLLADGRVAAPLADTPPMAVHNDAKIPNLRVDASGAFRYVVDLDTTMPGSPLFDVGELVRTAVSDAPEDVDDPLDIQIDRERVDAINAGFLDGAGRCVDANTRSLLDIAGARMALENGVRFLTDHLDGDRYFAVHRDGHNLIRARAQLRLCDLLLATPQH